MQKESLFEKIKKNKGQGSEKFEVKSSWKQSYEAGYLAQIQN